MLRKTLFIFSARGGAGEVAAGLPIGGAPAAHRQPGGGQKQTGGQVPAPAQQAQGIPPAAQGLHCTGTYQIELITCSSNRAALASYFLYILPIVKPRIMTTAKNND